MKFEVHESTEEGIAILEPDGDLSDASSAALQARVLELTEEGRHLIVIDLAKTTSATSQALRVLLMLSKKLQSLGGRLVICCARSDVGNALALSGLNRLCCVTAGREQAIGELRVEEKVVRLAALVAQLLGRAEARRAATGAA